MLAFNTSILSSPAAAAYSAGKKDCRSSKYNNFTVDIVDFDSEVVSFEIEARTESEAVEIAEEIAAEAGLQVSYCNVYCYDYASEF